MRTESSDCIQHFGYQDFKDFKTFDVDPAKLQLRACPIKDCSTNPVSISYRKSTKLFCPTHGIRLHSNTFVYWNGEEQKDQARLRNFRIRPDLACDIALRSVGKADSHRLGYEMSEDALTWNVFVGLAQAGKLRLAVKFLTNRDIDEEPSLYLWGRLVDVKGTKSKPEYFEPLGEIRKLLEQDIRHFKTEPDVMLVVNHQLVICVEAKFGSGNTLAHEEPAKIGHKSTDRQGLLQRYLDRAPLETKRIIDQTLLAQQRIGESFHSQLFRNIIFASAMAKGSEWNVVNLVSETQRKLGKKSDRCSYDDPEESIRSYLHPSYRECFSFWTWEELYGALIKDDNELVKLDAYFRTKSAHYRKAFDLG